MTLSIFGEKVKDLSVTGAPPLRTGRTKEAVPANEFMALRDIYKYYLTTYKGWSNEDVYEELNSLEDHLRLALGDLSKQPKSKHAKPKTRKKPDARSKDTSTKMDKPKKKGNKEGSAANTSSR